MRVVMDTVAGTRHFIEIEERYGAHNYHPLDVVIERAEGVWAVSYTHLDVYKRQAPCMCR